MAVAERSLLAVFAHPDDESLICGGTLARYAAAGVAVTLVCATRGQAGDSADPAVASAEMLAAAREAELREAAAALGVADVRLLDYRDGTLAEVPFPEGAERLGALVAATRPTVVITFGPEGVYGHPDHVAVHRWTKEAFHLARSAEGEPAAADGRPRRLYYCAPPRSWYRALSERARVLSLPDRYGPMLDWLGVPDELVTARLDVAAAAPARMAAIRAHVTQREINEPFFVLPDADMLELLAAEWFTRSWPPMPSESPLETDLFGDDEPC